MLDTKTSTHFQFLRFELNNQYYALDVLKVREVLSAVKITPLPSSLDFLAGVINLRGSVIPVVDLRTKFQLGSAAHTADTSIIIVEIETQDEKTVVGALVDAVKDVYVCEQDSLEPPPRFGMKLNTKLVKAISKRGTDFVIVLDADQLFSESELWMVHEQSRDAELENPVGESAK